MIELKVLKAYIKTNLIKKFIKLFILLVNNLMLKIYSKKQSIKFVLGKILVKEDEWYFLEVK